QPPISPLKALSKMLMPSGSKLFFVSLDIAPPDLHSFPTRRSSDLYYPLGGNSAFKPYVGAGLNYTIFFDEELTGARKTADFNSLSLDSSFGLAFQVGADYMLNDKLMINAQIRYIDIGTEATMKLNTTPVKVDVDVDPLVYMVGLGYKF